MVQIEDIAAVKRIDEILSVPGIDGCFIGPNDLCNSMGLAPSLDPPHKEYEEAIQAILRSARKHGVAPGVHTPGPEAANRRLAEGWLMVGCTSDLYHLTAGAKAALAAIKKP